MYNYNDINKSIEENNLINLKKILLEQPELLISGYNGDRDTPLHHSAEYGTKEICDFFIEKGINIDIVLKKTETPLNYASSSGNIENLVFLLKKGASIDGVESSIISPLISAVTFNKIESVKILISNGANVNRMHIRTGQLPLDIALSRGYKEIAAILRENGAKTQFEAPDWLENDIEGIGILGHVSLKAGKILPVDLKADKEDSPVVIKLATANNKKNRLLFTFGLFSVHQPRIELFITLPEFWNFYITTPENQFPILLLSEITRQIKKGMTIKEGDYILKSDERFSFLNWTEGIACFFVSDVNWKSKVKDDENIDDRDEEKVLLLSLIPVKETKKGFAEQSIEKSRDSGWSKLCLNI